jgi:hypothetical protein
MLKVKEGMNQKSMGIPAVVCIRFSETVVCSGSQAFRRIKCCKKLYQTLNECLC